MPTYNSTALTANSGLTSASSQLTFPGPIESNCIAYFWTVNITANAANLDIFNFGVVPKGFRVMFALLQSTDIDTNGSPTVTINVGDSGSANRLFAASTVGQAGTNSSAISTAAFGFQYQSDTLITGAIPTGPATGTTGTVTLALIGRVEGLPS